MDILADDLDFMEIEHRSKFKRYLSVHQETEVLSMRDSIPTSNTERVMVAKSDLKKDPIIVLRVIGVGSSGRVYLCLYAPTLTFIAVCVIL